MINEPMDERDILQIVASELQNANYSYSDVSAGLLEASLSYYLGAPNGREVEGQSAVTSTDVCDAIEWIMPQVMESFTQNNEIVKFDPVNPGDEQQSEIESEYVYDVLMKENNGFILIHEFLKDALIQRNGILKVFYENNETQEVNQYSGLTEQELTVLLSNPDMELISMETSVEYGQDGQPIQLFSPTVSQIKKSGRVKIESIPLEEFRINSRHNSINVDDARFTAHVVSRTVSSLIEEGYPEEKLTNLPGYGNYEYRRRYRFALQGENSVFLDPVNNDESQELIEVSECYMKLDINGDGISEYCKIVVAGSDNANTLLSIEEIDTHPWITTTGILMSHKFQGLSMYDRLKQIQDQKTALIRNIFDNFYLQNNQRTAVLEGAVNLDDLMVSRPGGLVRCKNIEGIKPLINAPFGQEAFQMMEYLNNERAGRSGVSPDGNATPQKVGENVGSEGVDRLMNAKEALVGLIIRVFAETGIKPLCFKIRDLLSQHTDAIQDYQYRGQWIKVNPATWSQRCKSTVRIGTGTGDVRAKLAALTTVMGIQEKFLATGTPGVDPLRVYSALDDFCKLSGLNGASRYFTDPNSPQGQQAIQQKGEADQAMHQEQQAQNQAMIKMQLDLAQAEMQKASAQQANVQVKAQADADKHAATIQKQMMEAQIKALEQQLNEAQAMADTANKSAELQFKYDQLEATTSLALTKLEAETKIQQEQMYMDNEEAVDKDSGDSD